MKDQARVPETMPRLSRGDGPGTAIESTRYRQLCKLFDPLLQLESRGQLSSGQKPSGAQK